MPPDAVPDVSPVPAEKRHLILSLARPEAYVPMARSILGRIGYSILSPDEWRENEALAEQRAGAVHPGRSPARRALRRLRHRGDSRSSCCAAAAARRSRTVASSAWSRGRRVCTSSSDSSRKRSSRSRAAACACSRTCPCGCAATGASGRARCSRSPRTAAWCARPSRIELGAQLDVAFELPRSGRIETQAETSYQLLPDTGLVFQATPPATRRAILSFVEELLAA